MLYASIDIGTNSALLLIASWESGKLTTRLERITEPRIGRGLNAQGRIPEASVKSLLGCLREFNRTIFSTGALLTGAAGTQAFRKAENCREVLDAIKSSTGVECFIPDGAEEAELSFLAVKHLYNDLKKPLVIDIGGGSTELALEDRKLSLPLGAVALAENNGRSLKRIREEISPLLEGEMEFLKTGKVEAVVAGGTGVTLVMMEKSLERYDYPSIEGAILSRTSIKQWLTRLNNASEDHLASITGLPASRRELILPGAAILYDLMKILKITQVTVSTWGVRQGIILKYLKKVTRQS